MPLNPSPACRPGLVYPLHACTSWCRLRQCGWGAVLRRPTLLWEGTRLLEDPAPCKALSSRALTLGVSKGVLTGRSATSLRPAMLWLVWWVRLQKERLDGCLFPITLPVTDGLGENAADALNALVPVPASDGGRRPCARGLSIRTSLFPYSTVAGARAPVDSHDALSVFEATNVHNRACGRGASSQGPSICVRVLSSCASVKVPLTDTFDIMHARDLMC